jgi:ABC-2 type transport system ATP-binding protein
MISIQNLHKQFGKHVVLDNINLVFAPGKVYGIVGENGAGKTTLFRCMAGLETFDGDIAADHTPLKDHLGLLLTEPFFFTRMTGREYIQLLCNARGITMPDMKAKNIFDLPLGQYASTYSTGMKKKLALTAILLQENAYYILDEPFNGIDIQSNIILTGIIQKLRSLQKTIILSSHIFSTLRETCDEIHVLHEGRLLKSVERAGFDQLEAEMKTVLIGNKIEDLGLQ